MRLTKDVALVGGGNSGFNLSAPGDCHVYLLDGGNGELALFDAGLGGSHGDTAAILENLGQDGFDPERITSLFLTHYHADHAGGCRDWVDRFPDIEVIGSPLTAQVLRDGDELAISLPEAKTAGLYPDDYVFRATSCSGSLVDGGSFPFGNLTITPFDTPGHSAGHVSFLVEGGVLRYLIAGDLVFWGGTIVAQNIHDCNLQDYAASVDRISREVAFDSLLPGHLAISLRDGKRHVEKANSVFKRLGVPRNAV